MKARLCPRCAREAHPALYLGAPGWVCTSTECSTAWGPAAWLADLVGFFTPGMVVFPYRRIPYWRALRLWWQAMGGDA